MGDRTSVEMRIGGAVPLDQVEKLADALQDECFSEDWSGERLTADRIRELDGPLVVYASEVNYADTSDLDAVLREIGLDWQKTWDAGGGYPAGGERHVADGGVTEFSTTGMGNLPVVDLGDIRGLGTLEAVVERLEWLGSEVRSITIAD